MTANVETVILLVAGEESGDRLGAALMRALRNKTKATVRFVGVGGQQMRQEGLESFASIEMTGVVGFVSLLGRIRSYWRLIREIADRAVAAKPDVAVIIDSPEFTHRVAKRLRRAAPAIPIVDYVSPSVWAWRPWRARAMRRYVDHVLALLPFEPAVMKRLGGPACTYVGHPLTERVDALRPSPGNEIRRQAPPAIVLLMPGSRLGEMTRMLPIFERTAALIAKQRRAVEFVVPAVPALADRLKQVTAAWPVPVRIVSGQDEKDAAFRDARLAVVKSGTSTLELALAGVPMIAAYRLNPLEALVGWIAIRVPSIILANLVIGENVVPEFVQYRATPERLAAAALDILDNGDARRRQLDAFKRLDAIMEIGRAVPSERAADIVLAELDRRRPGP
ncbi:MAG: lipid-A-disaccharide synthase [Pseudolabrys sp.]|jgi:lipid-A-disaccharide synthase|nr:lipid-A-disaccharide synthase [Pseudolabrys sp.]